MGKIKYWNINKKSLLKNVMNLSMAAAWIFSAGHSGVFCYEPEIPKALKKKLEK